MKKINLSLNLKQLKTLTPKTLGNVVGGLCQITHAP